MSFTGSRNTMGDPTMTAQTAVGASPAHPYDADVTTATTRAATRHPTGSKRGRTPKVGHTLIDRSLSPKIFSLGFRTI